MRSFVYLAALLSLLNAVLASPVASPCLPVAGVDTSDLVPGTGSAGPSVLNGLSITDSHKADTTHSSDTNVNGDVLPGVLGGKQQGVSGGDVLSTVTGTTSSGNNALNGVVGTQQGVPGVNGLSVDTSKHDSVTHDTATTDTVNTNGGASDVSLGGFGTSSDHRTTQLNAKTKDTTSHDSSQSTGLSLGNGKGNKNGITIPITTGGTDTGTGLNNIISTDAKQGSTSTNGNGLSVGAGGLDVNGDHRDSRTTSTDTKVGNALHQTTSSGTTHKDNTDVKVNPASGDNSGNTVVSANNDSTVNDSRQTTVTTNGSKGNPQTAVKTKSDHKDSTTQDATVSDRNGSQSGNCAL